MRDSSSPRTLNPAKAGNIYGKLTPSPLGKIRVTEMGEDGDAKVTTVTANRAERGIAQKEADKRSLENYRELRGGMQHG